MSQIEYADHLIKGSKWIKIYVIVFLIMGIASMLATSFLSQQPYPPSTELLMKNETIVIQVDEVANWLVDFVMNSIVIGALIAAISSTIHGIVLFQAFKNLDIGARGIYNRSLDNVHKLIIIVFLASAFVSAVIAIYVNSEIPLLKDELKTILSQSFSEGISSLIDLQTAVSIGIKYIYSKSSFIAPFLITAVQVAAEAGTLAFAYVKLDSVISPKYSTLIAILILAQGIFDSIRNAAVVLSTQVAVTLSPVGFLFLIVLIARLLLMWTNAKDIERISIECTIPKEPEENLSEETIS